MGPCWAAAGAWSGQGALGRDGPPQHQVHKIMKPIDVKKPLEVTTAYYPESDGKPMGETDQHRDAMVRIIELLKSYFAGQPVYVSGALLLYYEQGNPKKFVVPDAFIAMGLQPHQRRIYRLWLERVIPQLVIETTSKTTKKKDVVEKAALYAKLGVKEYFLHDPTREYLEPPLQGHRWREESYERMEADNRGRLFSEELQLWLCDDDGELNLYRPESDERLLTHRERAAEEAAARQRETEARLRAEAEVARLRAELEQRNATGSD